MNDSTDHIDVTTVLAEFAQLKVAHVKLGEEYAALKLAHQALMERYRALENGIYFQGREKMDSPDQPLLPFMNQTPAEEAAMPSEPPPPPPETPKKNRPKPIGRKPLPENLPVVEIEELPAEVKAAGLDSFERIGQDTTETVERRSASLVVVRIIRPKFVRKADAPPADNASQMVCQAAPLELPIERGLAGPGLLATTIVNRWGIHIPLHRMEDIFRREGWAVARSTICGWHFAAKDLVKVIVDAMWGDARRAPLLCTDATGVLVQQVEKCRRAHFFVVVAPERHVLFGYSSSHSGSAIDKLLGDFTGALVADASTIYDHLYDRGTVKEHGCWAHVRRYFFKSLDSDSERSRHAIALIGRLFDIERDLPTDEKKRLEIRAALSRPVVHGFFEWCMAQQPRVLSESPIYKAIQYALNQQEALKAFMQTAHAPIHNNVSERELRREAIGRKNWLFLGNDDGGEVNATFVSLIASCRIHGIEPVGYLRDILCLLPSWNQQKALELSPLHWKETSAREDVRAKLDGNIYRKVALGQLKPKSE